MSTWMMRARVRVTETVEAANPYSGGRTYRAGEELEMILRGTPGHPLSAASWWSSTDVDGAYILSADQVTVLEMLGPVWVKCGGCGEGGQIERGDDRLAYVDVGGRIARRRRAAAEQQA